MVLTDTHTHLYLEEFKEDVDLVIKKAISNNVSRFFLPAINSKHNLSMLGLRKKYPDIPDIGIDSKPRPKPIPPNLDEKNKKRKLRDRDKDKSLYREKQKDSIK